MCECESVCVVSVSGGVRRLLGGGGGKEHGWILSSGRVNGPGPWAWRCLPLWPHRAAAVTAGKGATVVHMWVQSAPFPAHSHHNLAEPQCRTGYVPPPFPSFAFVSHLGSFGSPLAPSHRIPESWRETRLRGERGGGEALSFILPYPSALPGALTITTSPIIPHETAAHLPYRPVQETDTDTELALVHPLQETRSISQTRYSSLKRKRRFN